MLIATIITVSRSSLVSSRNKLPELLTLGHRPKPHLVSSSLSRFMVTNPSSGELGKFRVTPPIQFSTQKYFLWSYSKKLCLTATRSLVVEITRNLNCGSSYTFLSSSRIPGLSTQYFYCRAVLQIEVLLLRVIFSSNTQHLLLSIPQTCITYPWVVLYSTSTLRWAGSHSVTVTIVTIFIPTYYHTHGSCKTCSAIY